MPGNSGVQEAVARFRAQVPRLRADRTTTERTYYPVVRDLWLAVLSDLAIPYDVRAEVSADRTAGARRSHPDLALYDAGEFLAVAVEAKLPDVEIPDLARSTAEGDQIGRYLAQTGVVLLTNIRSVGLLACRADYVRDVGVPVPPEQRELLDVADLWPSESALARGAPIDRAAVTKLAKLLARAATEFAPIASPSTLAGILARQARRAKVGLPTRFDAVKPLLDDYAAALGLKFENENFFRSSLIQTAYYSLFAAWTLWHRAGAREPFEWERIDRYLRIPFLGKLFHEFRHPDRLEELGLGAHLDRAAATLGRVDRDKFFRRFSYGSVDSLDSGATAAITYFYEPFLAAFDPELRKEMGVWYTPREVVRYQVRRVERLLRDELGCPDGFADERVVVLDPCCGTGAYLLEVTKCVAETLRARGDESLVGAELLRAVSTRIVGFEILTAPFVVAQLQLWLLLSELGAEPSAKQRAAVYLTNALTGWKGPEQVKLHFPELQDEHDAARRVKREAKIIVIVGNPPYNRFAGVAMDEEADLVDHYKGIRRKDKVDRKGNAVLDAAGRRVEIQTGASDLFTRFGVQKQTLDDLYVRFFRLAEERIGEVADEGVVSFISNSSWLSGLSHPLMRESLVRRFSSIWIDNLHGNRNASERTPWGASCETIFSTDEGAGIKVGTAIATLVKRRASGRTRTAARVHSRDFWGRADAKRRALLESLSMDEWDETTATAAASRPEGPRPYEALEPVEANRWLFAPREESDSYASWPALNELFPTSFQGVNPNRGLDDSVVDVDRGTLDARMRDYLGAEDFETARTRFPALAEPRAGYDARNVWESLRRKSPIDAHRSARYLVFPFDVRWLYYETSSKLLNRARPDLGVIVPDNELLVSVPQPRRVSESRPLFATCLVDLHLHDRGSVCFPREVTEGSLLGTRAANLAPQAWCALRTALGVSGDLASADAKSLVGRLFRHTLAITHSPKYQSEHAAALATGWARVPIARDSRVLGEGEVLGAQVAILLDPLSDAKPTIDHVLGADANLLGAISRAGGLGVREEDLGVTVSYYGAARGRWSRGADAGLLVRGVNLGTLGDLYINDTVFFRAVPEAVWTYELGGYPVLKKWLGYRQANRRGGHPLSLPEARHFRSMVHRVAALLALGRQLDELYEKAAADFLSVSELSLPRSGASTE